jgi:hypothetical protein
VVARDQLWLYYGGQAPPPEAVKGVFNNEALRGSAGLATLRLDGFTHLALQPGQTAGTLTTVPLAVRPGEPLHLMVNADCTPDATLTVEVLDPATGQPVPGFGRTDCNPLTADGLNSRVAWKGGSTLPLAGRERIAFRFVLRGTAERSPRLYRYHLAAAGRREPEESRK